MDGKEPQISFREEWRCDGLLSTAAISVPLPNISISRTKYRHSAEIAFSGHLGPDNSPKIITNLFSSPTLRFSSRLHRDTVLIAECVLLRSHANILEGVVTKLDIGVAPFPKAPTWQAVKVRFTPTHLAQSEVGTLVRSWTGEIRTLSDDDQRPLMALDTPLGQGTFSQYIAYEDAYVEGVRASVQIPIPTLSIDINRDSRTIDVGALLEGVTAYLAPFEVLISFLSRRQVQWAEIEVVSKSDEDHSQTISSARRLRSTLGSDEPDNLLIVPARLGERDLNEMLQVLLACPYRESVEHAIYYLNAHWRRGTIEARLANAFTAFETLVNGIDSVDQTDTTLTQPVFKSLRTILETHIKRFSIDHGVDKLVRKEIYAKLSELQRRPIISRAISKFNKYEVRWKEFRSNDATPEEALSKAYERRSKFLHTGRIDDYGDAVADADWLHTLTERLVYNLLGGKKEWLHPFAYPSKRWIPAN